MMSKHASLCCNNQQLTTMMPLRPPILPRIVTATLHKESSQKSAQVGAATLSLIPVQPPSSQKNYSHHTRKRLTPEQCKSSWPRSASCQSQACTVTKAVATSIVVGESEEPTPQGMVDSTVDMRPKGRCNLAFPIHDWKSCKSLARSSTLRHGDQLSGLTSSAPTRGRRESRKLWGRCPGLCKYCKHCFTTVV